MRHNPKSKSTLYLGKYCVDVLYYYHSDHIGSSTFLTDALGIPYEFMLYLPFGEAMAQQKVAGWSTPYTFTGKEQDAATGLHYFGARYLDTRLSIWFGVDPLAEKGPEFSPYVYTFNNPIKYTDPDGRWPLPSYAVVKASVSIGLNWVSNTLKGVNSGTNQRYQTEPARGDTKAGIRDTQAGRKSNATGKPVGEWVVRADQAHKGAPQPHLNFNSKLTGVPDPHTAIPGGTITLKGLETTSKTLNSVSKFAVPLAIATDVVRLGTSVQSDGGTIGANTVTTAASVAGGWAGAAVGASVGAEGGAAVGAGIGVWFFGVGAVPGAAIGGFIGGLGGGIIGAFTGSTVAEKVAKEVVKQD